MLNVDELKSNIKPTIAQIKAVVIPHEIKKAFIKSNLKALFLLSLAIILLIVIGAINTIIYLDHNQLNPITKYFSSQTLLVISAILICILVLIFIINFINFNSLKIDLTRYKISILNGEHRIPFTITKIYRTAIKKPIIINWLLIPTYFSIAIFIAVIYAIAGIYNCFNAQFIWNVKNITIYLAIFIGILFLIHIAWLLSLKMAKAKIDAYYGYEIIIWEQQLLLKKQTNKKCVIFFLILLIPLTIIWIIIRKLRKKPIFFKVF